MIRQNYVMPYHSTLQMEQLLRIDSERRQSPEAENPLGCELWDWTDTAEYPKDEKELSQLDSRLGAMCFCNQSPICATKPETFESILNTQRSNLPFYAVKAAEIVLKYMRAGEMPNNATEAFEEFKATSSTLTSTADATTTLASTTVDTTTTTETYTTDTSTTSTETPTSATSTTSTETFTSATSTTSTETSTTVTSTTSTETSRTSFTTASDYEYLDTSTTSAYDDSTTFVTDTAAEAAEAQQMDSFFGQYGLVIAVAAGILLIIVIVVVAYMMRKGKGNESLDVAVGKGGTSNSKESKGTSKEGSKEIKTSQSKEGGSKEKKTGSKD
uniref:Mucin-5AC-like n=1 Tax=Haemonchus contortus TaxID=6289 RepID=A0A7I4XXS0_HAECO